MCKLCLIWISIAFVGCVTTTKISDTAPPEKISEPGPKIIRINPNIGMPIRDQILWYERLEQMSAEQKLKTFRMLRDGMFKTSEQMEELDMIYPRKSKGNDI